MDIEFHYHLTYLIAAKAGFQNREAEIIAYASQMTDDNNMIFEINRGSKYSYKNYISQTTNILKPKSELFRIYSHFHFIPGNPEENTAKRKDGKMHWLNTTPASQNAYEVFNTALSTYNLYRIGLACHAFADTFAHQNFVGYYDAFNSMNNVLDKVIPSIGHAGAMTYPDQPAFIWTDNRLFDDIAVIYNKSRFLEAAKKIFLLLKRYKTPDISEDALITEAGILVNDLEAAIGIVDKSNIKQSVRIKRYNQLAKTIEYGNSLIPEYIEGKWLNNAVIEDTLGIKIKTGSLWDSLNPFPESFNWKDKLNYKETDWYQFQEAVKAHQNETWEILKNRNFANVQLEKI